MVVIVWQPTKIKEIKIIELIHNVCIDVSSLIIDITFTEGSTYIYIPSSTVLSSMDG